MEIGNSVNLVALNRDSMSLKLSLEEIFPNPLIFLGFFNFGVYLTAEVKGKSIIPIDIQMTNFVENFS